MELVIFMNGYTVQAVTTESHRAQLARSCHGLSPVGRGEIDKRAHCVVEAGGISRASSDGVDAGVAGSPQGGQRAGASWLPDRACEGLGPAGAADY